MDIEYLTIEITRNCTLFCEHCCRGDKEAVNMDELTIDNIFKDVKHVSRLLITGGEPLIAIDALERLVEIIKEKGVVIDRLDMIINGTVLSSRHLKVLKELSQLVNLDLRVSANIFHMLEIKRLGFMEMWKKNVAILKELFNIIEYSRDDCRDESDTYASSKGIENFGRAKNITEERLAEINKMVPLKYIKLPYRNTFHPYTYADNNKVFGTICVDVYGNLVFMDSEEYKLEDEDALKIGININRMSLMDAVTKFSEYYHKTRIESRLYSLKQG